MSKYQYHEDGTQPNHDEIFVFGSNQLVAVMFKHAPTNCNFPEPWKQYLE